MRYFDWLSSASIGTGLWERLYVGARPGATADSNNGPMGNTSNGQRAENGLGWLYPALCKSKGQRAS